MFTKFVKAVFGDPMERALAPYREAVIKINALEPEIERLSDEALAAKTQEFKERLASGKELSDILAEAFAVVREAARRSLGLRHHDVQLIGGMVLHEGRIAEMKTGEGKTLVATLPIYLNALSGKGVHLVTPNDYLSKVGLQQMGSIYHFLGLSSAVIQNTGGSPDGGSYIFDPTFQSEDDRYQNLRPTSRREAYYADITYGTNNEFGFDYLRDNMAWQKDHLRQRELNFAIVDEIDNILVDEARTPLIISGQADEPSDLYSKFAALVKKLKRSTDESVDNETPDGDFVVDIKDRISYLTEAGVEKIESMLNLEHLYHPDNAELVPYLDSCLRAFALYHLDRDYVVQEGEVVIVDDFTGRLMPGRRFSEGLHQAIEAKEGVKIRRENVTMATITFQNFFRMYEKLAGMTGTAATEAEEFEKIYELDVVVIPTNVPVSRMDNDDYIYMNEEAKWRAVVQEIRQRHEKGQPVLVGTVAIETSEKLGKLLKREGFSEGDEYEILNAKNHFREAEIIAQAGRPGAITIATNMAGRGVDIKLGGNAEGLARSQLRREKADITEIDPEKWQSYYKKAIEQVKEDRERVIEAGGLFVLGTERHEARRIDNQLRGRSGRQGEPGESRFYISLEDDLMRRFNAESVKKFMTWANLPEEDPIEHGMISKSIEQAQVRVEGHNFDIRKRVLDYDDVVNRQRTVIYGQRRDWLDSDAATVNEKYHAMIQEEISELIERYDEGNAPENWDVDLLYADLLKFFPVPVTTNADVLAEMSREGIKTAILDAAEFAIKAKENAVQAAVKSNNLVSQDDAFDRFVRLVILQTIDTYWQRHLTGLDMLREGIGLASLGRDPLVEYQRESFVMFNEMQAQISELAVKNIFYKPVMLNVPQRKLQMGRPVMAAAGGATTPAKQQPVRKEKTIEPNDKCYCGSGKKYKNCHRIIERQQQQKA